MRAQSTTNTTIDARRDKLTTQFLKLNKTSVECTIKKAGLIAKAQKELSKKEWTAWSTCRLAILCGARDAATNRLQT